MLTADPGGRIPGTCRGRGAGFRSCAAPSPGVRIYSRTVPPPPIVFVVNPSIMYCTDISVLFFLPRHLFPPDLFFEAVTLSTWNLWRYKFPDLAAENERPEYCLISLGSWASLCKIDGKWGISRSNLLLRVWIIQLRYFWQNAYIFNERKISIGLWIMLVCWFNT